MDVYRKLYTDLHLTLEVFNMIIKHFVGKSQKQKKNCIFLGPLYPFCQNKVKTFDFPLKLLIVKSVVRI